MPQPRVVIVGGGFGGLSCAKALDGKPVDVVLVDSRNYHLFTPLLYQVSTALLTAPDIARPFRTIFRGSPNVRFLQKRVTGADFTARTLHTADGDEVSYDYLVLATGSTDNYFGNELLAEHTISMKSLGAAQALRNHVLSCLERASQTDDQGEQREWLTFVVVGGGPTGVEYAGALNELLQLVLGRDYPELRLDLARIVVVEGQERLLASFSERLGRYAGQILERRGIDVETGSLVTAATAEHVTLSTGAEIATRTIVWCAGVRPTDPTDVPALARTSAGRIEVDDHLRLPGAECVFAIGDVSSVKDGGGELPMLSPPAMQEGRYVARAIVALAGGDGGSVEPFRYRDKGTMATIGRNAAVATLGKLEFTGFLGWVMWLVVHLFYIVGFRNRFAVVASWGWNYIHKDRPIRLITSIDTSGVTEDLLEDLTDRRETPA